jgi:carboxypeptidase C (cathepsin A)
MLFASSSFLFSQQSPDKSENKNAPEFKPEFPKEVFSETKHSITIDGKTIAYTATAGNMLLKEENGKPKANVFFVSYSKDGADPANRPVTFSFNGGPGSSSVWLHLGLLGPRRVVMGDDGHALPPPYKLADNPYSMLDLTDLVFIDPVTTGYSRAVPGEDPSQYHGVQEDVQSVGEFIRLYTTRMKRWSSPKFLIGESYGTTRAAGLSGYLQQRYGMYLNGIMLISSILNFETADFHAGNDLPYILFLPTYTATAWYHKKLSTDLQSDLKKALEQSEQFARGEYASALMKGDQISPEEKKSIVQKLAILTGLSEKYVEETNMRIEIMRFTKELLRDQRLTVGRLDSRFTGRDVDAAGEQFEYDPSYAAIQGSFTATLNQYLRVDLKYESDIPYEILTGRVWPWKFGDAANNQYLNVADTLRNAMNVNESLRVFVACGYYDFATPYYASIYTFSHLGLEPALRDHVSIGYYEAGHMMYISKPELVKLKSDLSRFMQTALPK